MSYITILQARQQVEHKKWATETADAKWINQSRHGLGALTMDGVAQPRRDLFQRKHFEVMYIEIGDTDGEVELS